MNASVYASLAISAALTLCGILLLQGYAWTRRGRHGIRTFDPLAFLLGSTCLVAAGALAFFAMIFFGDH